jgi:hypothetical protein
MDMNLQELVLHPHIQLIDIQGHKIEKQRFLNKYHRTSQIQIANFKIALWLRLELQ